MKRTSHLIAFRGIGDYDEVERVPGLLEANGGDCDVPWSVILGRELLMADPAAEQYVDWELNLMDSRWVLSSGE